MELNAVVLGRSGVLPRTSMRPPCLRKAARSVAMLWLVMSRLLDLPALLRRVCVEGMLRLGLALRGMGIPSVDSPLASGLLAGGGTTYPWRCNCQGRIFPG